jgi:tryptophan synthase beta subunit
VNPGRSMLVCLSGRGDKDMSTLLHTLLGREPS